MTADQTFVRLPDGAAAQAAIPGDRGELPPIDLRPLFAPRSVAVVGASTKGGIAETVRANLGVLGSATRCHFVNPRYAELHGQPCYPSIAELPEVPDLVLVAVNPLRAAAVVADVAAAGVPAAIIPGGGTGVSVRSGSAGSAPTAWASST